MRPDDLGVDPFVDAAIAGDRMAQDRLLRIVHPHVLRYCRARFGRRDDAYASADDIAQEVCLAVLTALRTYRDQGRPFLAFVYGIAAHKVIDAHRAAGRNRSEPVAEFPEEADREPGPEQHVVTTDTAARMARLMSTLPPKQQEILTLRVVVGLSAEETAEAVGSTPGAVRVAQHRALAKLRGVLVADPMDLHARRPPPGPATPGPGALDAAGPPSPPD